MHRKQNTDLIPANTKLERTLRSLRKTKRAENSTMAEERQDQTEGQRTAARRPPITDTNTLQSDSLQLMLIILN